MELLQSNRLEKDAAELKAEMVDATGQKRARIIKRLEVVESFRASGNPSGMDDHDSNPVIPRICVLWYSLTVAVLQHLT